MIYTCQQQSTSTILLVRYFLIVLCCCCSLFVDKIQCSTINIDSTTTNYYQKHDIEILRKQQLINRDKYQKERRIRKRQRQQRQRHQRQLKNQQNNQNSNINIPYEKIIGGQTVDTTILGDNPYPYYAHTAGYKLCGATLIHKDILVTAAHCLDGFSNAGVYINTMKLHSSNSNDNDSNDNTNTINNNNNWYTVLKEFQHPLYANSMIDERYDIMLVVFDSDNINITNMFDTITTATISASTTKLSSTTSTQVTNTPSTKQDDTIQQQQQQQQQQYVQLNTNNNIPIDEQLLTIIGFGDTKSSGYNSNNLLSVSVVTKNSEECQQYYGKNYINNYFVIPSLMICNGSINYTIGGQDSCQGDSGGPVLLANTNIQVGIVSFGEGCGEPYIPSVNTRISSYTKWITLGICFLSNYPPSSTNDTRCTNIQQSDYELFYGKPYNQIQIPQSQLQPQPQPQQPTIPTTPVVVAVPVPVPAPALVPVPVTNPTPNSICYICGGDANVQISSETYTNVILYNNLLYTCKLLEEIALSQYVANSNQCNDIIQLIYTSSNTCTCTLKSNTNNNNDNTDNNTPTITPSLQIINTPILSITVTSDDVSAISDPYNGSTSSSSSSSSSSRSNSISIVYQQITNYGNSVVTITTLLLCVVLFI